MLLGIEAKFVLCMPGKASILPLDYNPARMGFVSLFVQNKTKQKTPLSWKEERGQP